MPVLTKEIPLLRQAIADCGVRDWPTIEKLLGRRPATLRMPPQSFVIAETIARERERKALLATVLPLLEWQPVETQVKEHVIEPIGADTAGLEALFEVIRFAERRMYLSIQGRLYGGKGSSKPISEAVDLEYRNRITRMKGLS